MVPFTAVVRDEFAQRWKREDPDLAVVTTTTSMGLTGVPFQALRRKKFADEDNIKKFGANWNRQGNLYYRLGKSCPWQPERHLKSPDIFAYFNTLLGSETYARARRLSGAEAPEEISDLKGLTRALSSLGLNRQMFRGNPMGVFVGAVDRESIDALMTGRPRIERPVLDWNLAVRHFLSDFSEREGDSPTKKPGVNTLELMKGKANRRKRASEVTFDEILLSRRLQQESEGEAVDDEESGDGTPQVEPQ